MFLQDEKQQLPNRYLGVVRRVFLGFAVWLLGTQLHTGCGSVQQIFLILEENSPIH
jgi:hypothetical protein